MKVFLLAAGRGERFRPVTERIPKALFPYLNVPLARARLSRLLCQGVTEAGVNLHHLGDEVERHLCDRPSEMPKLEFFRESPILGTAGALKNAARWLGDREFLVVNSDAAVDFDLERLAQTHAASGRSATLLTIENREPDRYTPLQAKGDRITSFGKPCARPLLYTGVCILSPRILPLIPEGEASLVADLWAPLLAGGEEIGYVLHEGPFADLGSPGDFLRASFEALSCGGLFPSGAGTFDERLRVLSQVPLSGFQARSSVIGWANIGARAEVIDSAVWDGCVVGEEARIERCLVAGGRIGARERHRDSLLWPGAEGDLRVIRLGPTVHGFQARSPRR